jgi:predicted ArsR family transcriptional regulator
MLLRLAAAAGLPAADAVEAGREHGGAAAARADRSVPCEDALVLELAELGFDPATVADEDGVTIGFTHCPFEELARANPELVCSLHRGLVEGFVEARRGGVVVAFHDIADRTPCQVEIARSSR